MVTSHRHLMNKPMTPNPTNLRVMTSANPMNNQGSGR